MAKHDDTQRLLEELLAQLHAKQASEVDSVQGGILRGSDGQLLGKISTNKFDKDSILNEYGPFGSKYSPTSVFNSYSKYGSKYGPLSINNAMTTTPPSIVVNGQTVAKVSANPRIQNRISPDEFFLTLEQQPALLLRGEAFSAGHSLGKEASRAYIEAADGTFLGKLNPNQYDSESIFNQYGNYGSEYSPTSIFNKYGSYGGEYSSLSPFNQYASKPPKIVVNGSPVAHLTVNNYLSPRVDPRHVKQWASENVAQYS